MNCKPQANIGLSLAELRAAYRSESVQPEDVIHQIQVRSRQYASHNIWIRELTMDEIQPYLQALRTQSSQPNWEQYPLWGVPFTVKDNIDLADIPTTAACANFSYTPQKSAFVVQQLVRAGAIPVGKTNMDQLATGLNGTRSPQPWGICKNAFDPDYISGGSSSGAAVALALGLASFSLGTDTAGSGRIPACFQQLFSLKPSRGLLSNRGLVPACRSLDCISIFALNPDDVNEVFQLAAVVDAESGYSRANPYHNQRYGRAEDEQKLAVIAAEQLQFFGDTDYQRAYHETLAQLENSGFLLHELDFTPFREAAELLYQGPWLTERYIAATDLLGHNFDLLLPVIRKIIEPGEKNLATAVFRAQYRLEQLKRQCEAELAPFDCLLTPTAGRHFTIAEFEQEPILHNNQLGFYTNFMNLLDMAAVAVPTVRTSQGRPFGITLAGPAMSDTWLLSIAKRLEALFSPSGKGFANSNSLNVQTNPRYMDLLVCGAHQSGMALNHELLMLGAKLKLRTKTAAEYRFYALPGEPARPGLLRQSCGGQAIEAEIWVVPMQNFAAFVTDIPAPLGIGKVILTDGSAVTGFLCEAAGTEGAEDITLFGSWRAWCNSPKKG